PGQLWRHGVRDPVATPIGPARDDGDPAVPACIAPSPDRRRIALATRRTFEDRATVSIFAKNGDAWDTAVLTDVPGASARVFPVWSPKGLTVMLHIVHAALRTSGMVAFRELDHD